MNIYNATHNLTRAIKNSNEYRDYMQKQKQVFQNTSTKKMVSNFRKKSMEIQMAKISGKKVDSRELNELKRLEETALSNPVVKEYFKSEMRFNETINDIYKILGEAIDIDLGIE